MFHGLSVAGVHCVQTAEDIDTISFAYDSPISPRSLKIWLTSVNPLPLQIWPQSYPPPVDLCVAGIWQQVAATWLKTAQWSPWTGYTKARSFKWYHLWPPLQLSLPQKGAKSAGTFCQIILALVLQTIQHIHVLTWYACEADREQQLVPTDQQRPVKHNRSMY